MGGNIFSKSNKDNNNFNTNTAQKLSNLITPVRVLGIVLDDSHPLFDFYGGWNALGVIQYESINNLGKSYDSNIESNKNAPIAFPASPNLKNYPLINEIVYILSLPNTEIGENSNSTISYYLNLTSLWNHPHHNAYPSIANEPSPPQQKDYLQTTAGSAVTTVNDPTKIFLGKTFVERSNIHPLLPFEGDFIQEGRWGNSIRLGSTVADSPSPTIINNWSETGTNGDPITIIRNGQGEQSKEGWVPITENIDNDESSVYLTSTQKIPLKASSISYVSYTSEQPDTPNQYAGKQIILNSGRLLFNTTTDHIMLSSAKSINLNAVNSVNIDTTKFITQADNIYLGKESQATEPLLLGNSTVNVLNILLDTLTQLGTALTSAVTTPAVLGAPSSIPSLQAFGPILSSNIVTLKAQLETIKSKRNFTV